MQTNLDVFCKLPHLFQQLNLLAELTLPHVLAVKKALCSLSYCLKDTSQIHLILQNYLS